MSFDAEEIRRIAHLARLGIEAGDEPRYAAEISRILDFVQQLDGARTDGVEPMAHPLDARQVLRPDAVTEENRRDEFLKLAPASASGLYLVPRVIE